MRSLACLAATALAVSILSACGSGGDPAGCGSEPTEEAEGAIRPFGSDAQLADYVAALEEKRRAAAARCSGSSDKSLSAGAPTSAGASAPADPGNANVTNNQEASVDEGGLIKNVGDALVVLRQGRLYAVDVAPGKAPTLTHSIRVARSEALNSGVWYDELLAKGDRVYVVGYRYGLESGDPMLGIRGLTEVSSFRLAAGKLTRLSTIFLESSDYYSGRNYASRLTSGRLVFYMPHYPEGTAGAFAYPRLFEATGDGKVRVVGPLVAAAGVSTSLVKPWMPTLHTVVRCELPDSGAFDCQARSIVGSPWHQHYVAADAVYLWATSHVYRFDLATLDVTAHAAKGNPIDQFAFRATDDELLVAASVGATNAGAGATRAELLRLPLAAFDKVGHQPVSTVTLAERAAVFLNRFVGDTLVAGVASADGRSDERTLVAFDPRTGARGTRDATRLGRVEPLGADRFLAISTLGNGGGLALEALGLADVAAPLGRVELPAIGEGEGRSHGFFYNPGEGGAGTFGYAVVRAAGYGASGGWGNGVSNLGFFDVAASGALAARGIVSAGAATTQCETSCVDWYGNTRPVFLRGRTYALMGSELVEVTLGEGAARGAVAELRKGAGEE